MARTRIFRAPTDAALRRWHAPRASAGLTLVELLIVLMIIAFASAIVIPIIGGVSNAELRSAARQLASGLRMARSEAVSQRRETFLVIDLAGRRFRIDRETQEHPLPKNVELKLFTAQKDLIDDKVGSIRFYPDGGSNGGRITLAAGERKFEVDVDWLTGRVAILD
jgi:general secretion pathway protein H